VSNLARPGRNGRSQALVAAGWSSVVRGAEAASFEYFGDQPGKQAAFVRPARVVSHSSGWGDWMPGLCAAIGCGQPSQEEPTRHNWAEKADVTWEEMFRFAYQKDLIPVLRELGA